MRTFHAIALSIAAVLGCGAGRAAQDDIIVNGHRPVLTVGAWQIDEGPWRSAGGGWQAIHGIRKIYYCAGRDDIEKLMLVMLAGKDNERLPLCDKVDVTLKKGILIARWSCNYLYYRSIVLRAPYDPGKIDAELEMVSHGNGLQNKGDHQYRKKSVATFLGQCPL